MFLVPNSIAEHQSNDTYKEIEQLKIMCFEVHHTLVIKSILCPLFNF